MRRKDRDMGQEFALSVLDTCEYAVLAMLSADGTPYCVPLSIVREGDFLYYHCAKAGQKTENLRRNPHVFITGVRNTHIRPELFTTEYESAMAAGIAEEVLDDAEKRHALRILCERHVPSAMAGFDAELAQSYARTAIWKIHMDTVTGKRLKYGPDGQEIKAEKPH